MFDSRGGAITVSIPASFRKLVCKLFQCSDFCSPPVVQPPQPPPPPGPVNIPQGPVPEIAVFNKSSSPNVGLVASSFAQLVTALQRQIDEHVVPHWGTPAKLTITSGPVAGKWWLGFFDDADVANALGYHDVTSDGFPLGKVFVKTTLNSGQKVSTVASHEILEMLGDPGVNLVAFPTTTTRSPVAYENADPVENDDYLVDGIPMSNFVFPEYFMDQLNGKAQTDYLNKLNKRVWPAMTPGGYLSLFENGNWTQIFGSQASRARMIRELALGQRYGHRSGRRVRLARGEQLVLSAVTPK